MDNSVHVKEVISRLQAQLVIARSELKNVRQQVINLKYKLQASIEEIKDLLKKNVHKCDSQEPTQIFCKCEFPNFRSIGKIESWFNEKRGIPRQGSICKESHGVIVLSSDVINNPPFALTGLEEFSHLWIIYHFHKTDSNHVRTKVAPPRLNGAKVGVYSTRSPHRPCPIGLTLVKIDKIVENKIHFSGVDMLDGTPVLDIKPYIPQYDNPNCMFLESERQVEGAVIEDEPGPSTIVNSSSSSNTMSNDIHDDIDNVNSAIESREAPDGEETSVKIPSWIKNASLKKLKVEFSKKGLSQFKESAEEEKIKQTILKVLEEDPRSVYLKEKLGSQFYTFSISDLQVTCKFDDTNQTVTIYQVQPGGQVCECGIPVWQCAQHSK